MNLVKIGQKAKLDLFYNFHLLQAEEEKEFLGVVASTATYPDAIITKELGRDLTGEVKRVSVLPGTQNPPAKGTERPWLGSKGGTGRKLVDLGNWSGGKRRPTGAFGRRNSHPGGEGMKRAPAALLSTSRTVLPLSRRKSQCPGQACFTFLES